MDRSRTIVALATLAALALAASVAVVAADTDGSGKLDGSCATGPGYRSTVLALDGRSGGERWRRTLPHPRDDAPRLADGRVLLQGCGVDVLDAGTGDRVAHVDEDGDLLGLAGGLLLRRDGDGVRGEPLGGTRGGLVIGSSPPYLGTTLAGPLLLAHDGAQVTAFDVATRRERWRAPLPSAGGAVVLDGDALVMLASDGSVYLLDATTGAVGWRAIPDAAGELGYGRLLALGEGVAVVATDDGSADASAPTTLVGLDLDDGRERWRRDLVVGSRAAVGRPLPVVDGTLVVASAPGVHGLDVRTGRDRWQVTAESEGPVAVLGSVVVDDVGSVLALDPRTGDVLWRRATDNRPLLGGDQGAGEVVVLDSPRVPYGMDDCC